MRGASLLLTVALFLALGAQTAFAAVSYISSVSISVDVAPVPGESLSSLQTGYTSDKVDVMIPSNEKYEISSADWSSNVNEVKLGGTYTLKVTLTPLNDYKFNSSYSSSKVTLRGCTFVSAQRQTSGKLVVTVKTKPAKGDLEEPEDAYWESTRAGSSKFGLAKWDSVADAAYDVYLYRGSKIVQKVTDLHTTSYNFYPYMTSKGTYTFRVRSIPMNDSVSAYASKSGWRISEELTVEEDEVSDGSGQSQTTNNNVYPSAPMTEQVGWIADRGHWFFKYPDGSYVKDDWANIGGKWYLFDSTGVMLTGWQQKNGFHYFLDESGAMRTGWYQENGSWYYLNSNGSMALGWLPIGDKTYYLNDVGIMLTGWQVINDQTFYFYPDGHKAVNEWVDGLFYVDLNGVWKR